MKNFSTTIEIQAPSDRVFAVLCDVERWPDWTSTMKSVRRIDAGPLAVGSRAQVQQPKLIPAVWQVTELDHRSFAWITRSPGVQITARHEVEENGSGSRATLSLEFTGLIGPLLARLYRSLNERYLATEARGLKARCEV